MQGVSIGPRCEIVISAAAVVAIEFATSNVCTTVKAGAYSPVHAV